jgi:hypothetical protein
MESPTPLITDDETFEAFTQSPLPLIADWTDFENVNRTQNEDCADCD